MSDFISTSAAANPDFAIVRDIYLSSRRGNNPLTWAEAEEIAAEQKAKRDAARAKSLQEQGE